MPDDSTRIPAIICHYAAFFRTWAHATPEISVSGNRAEVCLGVGAKVLVAVFGCRKKNWSLRSGTRGELAKAMASLLGDELRAPLHAGDGVRCPGWLRPLYCYWSWVSRATPAATIR